MAQKCRFSQDIAVPGRGLCALAAVLLAGDSHAHPQRPLAVTPPLGVWRGACENAFVFWSAFETETIVLPRQARDKHRETQKRTRSIYAGGRGGGEEVPADASLARTHAHSGSAPGHPRRHATRTAMRSHLAGALCRRGKLKRAVPTCSEQHCIDRSIIRIILNLPLYLDLF